ncbi:MAG: lipopolysaccharide transport periplasmic protein LptA [Pusillimonas sp.]|nr:MAG: lipopolysaccharide transport periplasmic protein LptA [Pusillimonas sp.]
MTTHSPTSATTAQPSVASTSEGTAGKSAKAAGAKKSADEPDTLILSDTLNYNDEKKESTFTGNVILTRGDMTLRADKLVTHEDADGFQYGTATVNPGNLVFVRQETPAKFQVIEARGLRAEYNGKTDQIEMIGKAIVTKFVCGKPFDTISGDRVTFNQKTNIYQAFGGANSAAQGGRVRSVAVPTAKSEAAAADCQKKSAKHPVKHP